MRKKWLDACKAGPSQETLLDLLTSCLISAPELGVWKRDDFEGQGCNKQNAAGIFLTCLLVQMHLKGDTEKKMRWADQVEQGWFYDDHESAADFLYRANHFLREDMVHSMRILKDPIVTQSYVALLQMSKLASLLLFGYLDVRKLEDSSPAAGSTSALFHGFRMFVSSSRRIFGLTAADVPARGAKEIVFCGLECLSRLSSEAWEMIGPMKNLTEFLALETISEKMQEETPGSLQKKSSR